MWIATKHGFFSIVRAHINPNADPRRIKRYSKPKPHPDKMMLRARVIGHIEALQEAYPAQLAKYTIKETGGTDYPYRLVVDLVDALDVITHLGQDIDYCNFKNEAKDARPNDTAYMDFLHATWSRGLGMERRPAHTHPGFFDDEVTDADIAETRPPRHPSHDDPFYVNDGPSAVDLGPGLYD